MINNKIKKIGVFCGANAGSDPIYTQATIQLAEYLVDAGITLVYGGSKAGLMGILADSVLKNNGQVIGVIPQSLVNVELAHPHLSELHIVNSMQERKTLIAELSDGFIMLPGGAGSLDEFFEMYTLAQLGYHAKPCSILNMNNYYDHLLTFLDHAVDQGFMKQAYRNMIIIEKTPQILLQKLNAYQAPGKKWIVEKELISGQQVELSLVGAI